MLCDGGGEAHVLEGVLVGVEEGKGRRGEGRETGRGVRCDS